ncbi:phage shock protein A (PspA) family protein [Lachnospiraceae bacterium RM5]|nr:phage shock protein A (PspA) family protein [Lachnospiraceae bacterium RM5]
MGIISRFKDIMSANINALLDKAEDPEKMIDQYLRNLESDLGKVKSETAAVMAEETRCKRELDECNAEIDKYQKYAEKAVEAGNDEDARKFLAQKNQLVEKQTSLSQAYEVASANSAKMKQMHDKLSKDIAELNARKDGIKAKIAAAKTQEKLNKLNQSVSGVAGDMSAFDRMEAKANNMLDKANAMSELNGAAKEDSVEDLTAKYDEAVNSPGVDDELAALKAKLGK